jgi:hypothetical protein
MQEWEYMEEQAELDRQHEEAHWDLLLNHPEVS